VGSISSSAAAPGAVTIGSGLSLSGGTLTAVAADPTVNVTSIAALATSYTLSSADNGKMINCNNTSGLTITIPSGLPIGFNCLIIQYSTGQVSLVSASGVTFKTRYGNKTDGINAIVTLASPVSNVIIASGNLTP
jgi:hypothetical protein